MQFAINDAGQRLNAFPDGKAKCPICKAEVIAKCGELNIWHWSHSSLLDCDSWRYEPKTEWHIKWQSYFPEEQREVHLNRKSQYHIADIYTSKEIVIEIQNSKISVEDIFERENFYGKMIWVINSKEFKHNLEFKEFSYDFYKEAWFWFITQYPDSDKRAFAIRVPQDDQFEQILPVLERCNFVKAFDKERDTEFWYNKRTQFRQELDKEIINAFSVYLLDSKMIHTLSDFTSYPTNFQWRNFRKTWGTATSPKFIDLNNGFLFYIITLHENGAGFGKIISRRKFLKKYRI